MTELADVSAPTADRRRFLFVMWEGGGNVPPQLALARKLAIRGHSATVLADPCIRPDAEGAGCRFVSFTRAPHRIDRAPASDFMRDWEARTPIGAFARVRDRVMFGPALAYAEDVLEEITANPVDVVAADYLLPGAAVGAEKAGAPTAILLHTIYQLPAPGMPGPGIGLLPLAGPIGRLRDRLAGGLFMRLFRPGLTPLNAARKALGLSPVSTVPEVFDRVERVLVLTSRAFDYEAERLPDNLRYVGPQLEDPAWTETWDSPWPADHPDPLVVVSLSTTPQNQAGTLQRVIDALGTIRVRGLVTTGPAVDPASLRVPGNVAVRRSAPHAVVFQQSSLVVTHAGHGTVIRALAAGVPLLCVPMGRDQPDVAARVVYRGAGLRLSPNRPAAAIADAVQRLLQDPGFAQTARRLSGAIAEECRRDLAILELERLGSPSAAPGAHQARFPNVRSRRPQEPHEQRRPYVWGWDPPKEE